MERLRRLAEAEFPALVRSTIITRDKLRVVLSDSSYIDFWWSTQIPGRYGHHWERRHVDGTIYRHDNMPHPQWQSVASFPKHFHVEEQSRIAASTIADEPELAVGVAALRAEAERVGRSMDSLDLGVLVAYGRGAEKRIHELSALGFKRMVLSLGPGLPEKQWPILEKFADLVKKFR